MTLTLSEIYFLVGNIDLLCNILDGTNCTVMNQIDLIELILLLNRMMGADIRLVTPGTYARVGSVALTELLATALRKEGKNPYIIPVGGSNSLGCFGYLDAVEEIINQGLEFDHLVFACGSGGTAAGLAIGIHLSKQKAKLHAVGVCDSPSYFYNHINEVAKELGLSGLDAESIVSIYPGQGIGYARSTTEELQFIKEISTTTGIILDPVYSGKALYHFVTAVQSQPDIFLKGQKILFLHTGGQFGLYDKSEQLLPLFDAGLVSKMDVTFPPR
jgi:D-cysteine desulfhydrase